MIQIAEGRGRRFPHLISHRKAEAGRGVLLGEGDSPAVAMVVAAAVGTMMTSLQLLQRGSVAHHPITHMIIRAVARRDQTLAVDGTMAIGANQIVRRDRANVAVVDWMMIGAMVDMRADKEEMAEEVEEEAEVGAGEAAELRQGAEEGGSILAPAWEVEVAGEMTGEKKNARK